MSNLHLVVFLLNDRVIAETMYTGTEKGIKVDNDEFFGRYYNLIDLKTRVLNKYPNAKCEEIHLHGLQPLNFIHQVRSIGYR